MRVIVTGNRGYIGPILVNLLEREGFDVKGIDSELYRGCSFCGAIQEIEHIEKDVRDLLDEDLRGADAIVHLAGLSNDPLGDYRPSLTQEINEDASIRLAKLAKKNGIRRFVFASSCSVYGASDDKFLSEKAAFNPVTPYAQSKANVEHALSAMADETFSPTFLRASTAYGVSPRLRFDLVVNNLTAWAFTEGRVHLKSDGSPWRPLVHIEDIACAYVAILKAPLDLVHNEAFNVGQTSENYRIKEVAEMVKDIIPNCEIDFSDNAAPDKRCYRVDCNKISLTLHDFKPQWTVRRGIEELYEAYKKTGLSFDDFEGSKFKRIAHIKGLVEARDLDENLRWNVMEEAI